jgi:hypothetical protein
MSDGLGDWRKAAIARILNDIPAAYPGGPSHKAGSSAAMTSLVRTKSGELIGFTTPSATAMALNISIQARNRALSIHKRISFTLVPTPFGSGKHVSSPEEDLYDFFESCMASATFAYLAIEAFCNFKMGRSKREHYIVRRNGKPLKITAAEAERRLSTSEKLGQILPAVTEVPTPSGTALWERFRLLEDARDSIVHMKHDDQEKPDHWSLFFQFLSDGASQYPEIARDVISHFDGPTKSRWLTSLPI